ncbi:MAG: FHA domain-containing protein [Acaryochloridaceae cyanobacterium SU_2_1]|nr:FHA domain-containing protein [Acaryochloridaceae cyanobacterium SU_2_1]
MITLTLLHPVQATPVQSWSFAEDSVIRIGRAVDNNVVLYSAVVSRYHVELRQSDSQWQVVNVGTNGTYLDGKRVHQAPVSDGNIMRLARSGPNIQIHLHGETPVEALVPQPADLNVEVNASPSPATPQPSPSQGTLGTVVPEMPSVDLPSPVEPSPIEPSSVATGAALPLGFYAAGQYSFPKRSADPQKPLRYPCSGEASHPSVDCQANPVHRSSLVCTDCGLPLKIWRQIGAYRVLKPLGTGDNTFLAWREGHIVVLKTLPPEWLKDADAVGLFQEQATQLCTMSHPGIPKIYEAFQVEGQPYLVTEMIYGQNLKRWVIDRGPLSQVQAIHWLMAVCDVLDYLHRQSPALIHRNLKPMNLIRPTIPHGFKEVVLVNFGELQLLSLDAGTFVGSVGYTAPELQSGQGVPASDLYALGATLVYVLTGQEPDAFYRLGNQEFRLHVEDVPRLSLEMAEVIQRLTHPHLEERYGSATEVMAALQGLLP